MTAIDLLIPRLTAEVQSLAYERLQTRRNFFRGETLDVEASRETVKLALILVRAWNPDEALSAEEEALLVGRTRETLKKLKDAKLRG